MLSADMERFRYLFARYRAKDYTMAEKEELFDKIVAGGYEELLEQLVGESWGEVFAVDEVDDDERADAMFQLILERVRVRRLRSKRVWMRWVAAAACVMVVVGGGWLVSRYERHTAAPVVVTPVVAKDVAAPVSSKAVLTLGDGKKVVLDSTQEASVVAAQGGSEVWLWKGNEVLSYEGWSGDTAGIMMNTLSNPRGSKAISVVLQDGTKVWLNAASTLTYPTAFVGKERSVEFSGEAYFEVAQKAGMPFMVRKGSVAVEVLGTSFNVNAYNDEPAARVTLLAGAVAVRDVAGGGGNGGVRGGGSGGGGVGRGGGSGTRRVLRPGQQAIVAMGGQPGIEVRDGVDVDAVIAWKNGLFNFNETDIHTVMRQIEKWYDVEVVYQDNVDYSFVGKISRNMPVSEVLKLMEMTDLVHFRIEGKKIIVMKK